MRAICCAILAWYCTTQCIVLAVYADVSSVHTCSLCGVSSVFVYQTVPDSVHVLWYIWTCAYMFATHVYNHLCVAQCRECVA